MSTSRRNEIQRFALSTRSIGFNTVHTDMQPHELGSFVTYDHHMLEVRYRDQLIRDLLAVIEGIDNDGCYADLEAANSAITRAEEIANDHD